MDNLKEYITELEDQEQTELILSEIQVIKNIQESIENGVKLNVDDVIQSSKLWIKSRVNKVLNQ